MIYRPNLGAGDIRAETAGIRFHNDSVDKVPPARTHRRPTGRRWRRTVRRSENTFPARLTLCRYCDETPLVVRDDLLC